MFIAKSKLAFVISLPLLVVCAGFAIHKAAVHVRSSPQRYYREAMQRKVNDVKLGKSSNLIIFNDDEAATFAELASTLPDNGRLKLKIGYLSDSDYLLKAIASKPSITTLTVETSSVSELGLEAISTLPNLQALTLYNTDVTGDGLKMLERCPALESVSLSPREPDTVSLPTVLLLPHLRRLTLYGVYETDWPRTELEELMGATSLHQLRLIRAGLSDEELVKLRAALPHCKVIVEEH